MYEEDAARLLKKKGFEVGNPAKLESGPVLVRINDVFMFQSDAEDLAHDRVTLQQIVERNKGKVFPKAKDA